MATQTATRVPLCRRVLTSQWYPAISGCHVPARQISAAIQVLAVVTAVAALTEHGRSRFQKARNIRAVRRMAIGAIVNDRGVLPKEGTTFFRVARIAGFVDRIFYQQRGPGRAVRVVTI